ncbi:MAG: beta-ketoacyl synthase N-terminal-like domain-containing protein, partial [Planctomycetota bacterium]
MKTITLRRVVVTGLGAVTDLGTDVASTWEGMMSGRSGIGPITAFEQDDEWTTRFAGEVSDFDPSKTIDVREAKRLDRA